MNASWKFTNGLLGFAVLLLVSVSACLAQSTATLSGTVTDPSGAVVPGAQVTVHSLATGLDRQLVTDNAGLYIAPSLVPGDYQMQVKASGFSQYTVQKVTLEVDQRVTVNIPLALSTAGETVQVESTASQIETQTITVGQVIGSNTVQELPLNGRHFLDLTVLTPGGVIAPTAGSLTSPQPRIGRELVRYRRQPRRLGELPDQRRQSERHKSEPDHFSAVDCYHLRVQDQQLNIQC